MLKVAKGHWANGLYQRRADIRKAERLQTIRDRWDARQGA